MSTYLDFHEKDDYLKTVLVKENNHIELRFTVITFDLRGPLAVKIELFFKNNNQKFNYIEMVDNRLTIDFYWTFTRNHDHYFDLKHHFRSAMPSGGRNRTSAII
jgi:hypothetical protein